MSSLPTFMPMQNGPVITSDMPQVLQQMHQQQAAQTDPPADPPEDPEGQGETDPKDGKEGDEGDKDNSPEALRADRDKWKAMSRKNQTTAEKNLADAKAWRDYQDSKKTDDERTAEREQTLQAERDETLRENALLKLGIKHGLDEDGINEVRDILEDVPADKFAERAEKLATRLAREATGTTTREKDTTLGRETPPAGGTASGDFLRDAMRRR